MLTRALLDRRIPNSLFCQDNFSISVCLAATLPERMIATYFSIKT